MAKLMPWINYQFTDDNGDPLAGGKVYTYIAGTSTPQATYTDESEGTPNANPVILDSSGRAPIWLTNAFYKLVVTDADDVVIRTIDDVTMAETEATAEALAAQAAAEAAATAAAASASAASTSASTASTHATTATTQASAASTSASSASTSASTATTQATNAATSATSAATSATNASTSATNASTSETNAAASADLAEDWATKMDGPVDGVEYSAKYYAEQAASAAGADVVGPASSTNNGFAKFDGTTGKLLKNSPATISNSDVDAAAAIARSKIASGSNNHVIINDGSGNFSSEAQLAMSRGGTNASLTAAAGAVPYSTGSALALLAAGTSGQIYQSNGTSAPSWVAKNIRTITSKTTTYTLALTDHIINASASGGAWTLTLPTVASASGYEFTIIKGDSSTNAITIDGNSTETIQSAQTRRLATQYESLTIYSNGSEWLIKEHCYPRGWVSFTPTGSWSTNVTFNGMWRRSGDSAEIAYEVRLTGAPTSAALSLNIPSSLTINTSKLPSTDQNQTLGICTLLDTGTLNYNQGKVQYASSTTVQLHYNVSGTSESQAITQAAPFTFANGDRVYARVVVPITNWEG